MRDHEVFAVGESEAALLRAKRGVAQRAATIPPARKDATGGMPAMQRAQAAAATFLHDRRKVAITGGALGVLIVVLGVMLAVRKPAPAKLELAAAPPAAEAAAPVAEKEAPKKKAAPAKADAARKAAAKAEGPPPGMVNLVVLPWGEVFVNGRSRGVSPPLKNLKLPPGTYTIEVRNTTFAPSAQKIQVKSREEVTVRHVFK